MWFNMICILILIFFLCTQKIQTDGDSNFYETIRLHKQQRNNIKILKP